MTMCLTARPRSSDSERVRVMRWTFRRDHETVVCELGLNESLSAYEIRVTPVSSALNPAGELYNNAMSAFQRHAAIERQLVGDGWSLESFESERWPR